MSYEMFFERALRWIVGLLLFALACLGLAERSEGQQHWSTGAPETYTITEAPQIYWDEKGNVHVDILNPYPREWTVERYDDPYSVRPPCPDR